MKIMELGYCYINLIIRDFVGGKQILKIYNIYNLKLLFIIIIKYCMGLRKSCATITQQ